MFRQMFRWTTLFHIAVGAPCDTDILRDRKTDQPRKGTSLDQLPQIPATTQISNRIKGGASDTNVKVSTFCPPVARRNDWFELAVSSNAELRAVGLPAEDCITAARWQGVWDCQKIRLVSLTERPFFATWTGIFSMAACQIPMAAKD